VEPRDLPQQMLLQKVVDKNGDVCYTLTASNIPSRKAEEGAPSVAEDAPQLFITGHFNDLKVLYNYFRSFEADETNNDDAVAETATRLTASCISEEEKVDSIAAWVRNNIRYVAVENGDYALRPASAGEVLSKRFGDCKGSANLIKAMLRDVGIDGRLVWVGTRGEVPTQWSEIPSLQSGNHQIACAVVNDSIIYVDGTASYAPDGYLPWGIRGREALIENGDDYILGEIPNVSRHPDKESLKGDFVIDGDNLRGSLSRTYTGHNRAYIANLYYSSAADKRKDLLERLLTYPKKNLVAEDAALRLNNLSDAECTVESVEAVDNGAARHAGNKCYVDLRPIRALGFDVVDVESRERALAAKPVSNYESEVKVKIPEGYSVEQLPEN
ncbi:MAG: transglutaminase-like domain-containing protein, partial [Muribaculaceae bacterium]|nr:transglutaminase-like domain-containing protein [Muribaculaceae bacterium]